MKETDLSSNPKGAVHLFSGWDSMPFRIRGSDSPTGYFDFHSLLWLWLTIRRIGNCLITLLPECSMHIRSLHIKVFTKQTLSCFCTKLQTNQTNPFLLFNASFPLQVGLSQGRQIQHLTLRDKRDALVCLVAIASSDYFQSSNQWTVFCYATSSTVTTPYHWTSYGATTEVGPGMVQNKSFPILTDTKVLLWQSISQKNIKTLSAFFFGCVSSTD